MNMRLIATITLLTTSVTAPAAAVQSTRTVDQGSFTITENGQRIGREDFTISVAPRGASMEYIATATVTYGDRRLSPELRTDSGGVAVSYRVEAREADAAPERWQGTIVRGRVSARIQTPRGQSAREYIVADGAIVLDDDVFHQYYFVARAEGPLTVMLPRRNTQIRVQVSRAGREPVRVGGQEIQATRLVLTEPGGAQREVWVDADGRVLKVAIPARNLVATRDDPPA